MIETTLLQAPDWWATAPAPDLAALLEQVATLRRENAALRAENAALRAENAALQAESAVLPERVRELDARLGETSANSSRPPSSDPPQAPVRPKAPPSGRKRGGQPRHRGACRGLLPGEQVDEVVLVVPERALRPAVLWRKGCFGSNREAGSRFAERLLTAAATCRQQGRPLLNFLVAAGEAALQGTAAPSLLPAPRGD